MKYPGLLGKKRPPNRAGLLKSEEEVFRENAAIFQLLFDALFDHYKIPRNKYHLLAGALAMAHVPAFQEQQRKAGRPEIWTVFSRGQLVMAVNELRSANPRLSVAGACNLLAAKEPFKEMLGKSRKKGEALRAQYLKADPRWTRVLEDARKLEEWKAANPEEAAKLAPVTLASLLYGTADLPKAVK